MVRFTRFFINIVILLILMVGLSGCGRTESMEPQGTIRLAVTKELEKTGLFSDLFYAFSEETGWQVELLVSDPSSVMEFARKGEIDALLWNDSHIDQILIRDGYANSRLPVLSYQNEVKGIISGNTDLLSTEYSITALRSSLHQEINETGALELSQWMVGQTAQSFIGSYGLKERRGQLFLPAFEGANVCRYSHWVTVVEEKEKE